MLRERFRAHGQCKFDMDVMMGRKCDLVKLTRKWQSGRVLGASLSGRFSSIENPITSRVACGHLAMGRVCRGCTRKRT